MSIESEIATALGGLVDGKVYPDLNDEGTEAPYIVYQRVGGQTPSLLENSALSKEFVRVQVTTWTTSRLATVALAKQVQDALVALTGIQVSAIGSAISTYDDTTQLRGAIQHFQVWADR